MINILLLLVLSFSCIGWATDGGWHPGTIAPRYNSITVAGTITTDGTIYTAKIVSDGAIYAPMATLDPCTTLGRGYIFFNTTGEPCYCNASNADVKMVDGSSCF